MFCDTSFNFTEHHSVYKYIVAYYILCKAQYILHRLRMLFKEYNLRSPYLREFLLSNVNQLKVLPQLTPFKRRSPAK